MIGQAEGLHHADKGIERDGLAVCETGEGAARNASFPSEIGLADIEAQPDRVEALAEFCDEDFTIRFMRHYLLIESFF